MSLRTIEEMVEKLHPLDIDGMKIMMDPPEQIPAYLVLRLCESKPLKGGSPRARKGNYQYALLRGPLAQDRGGTFRLTYLGKQVAAVMRAQETLTLGEQDS